MDKIAKTPEKKKRASKLSKPKLEALKTWFFTGGVTPYQVSRELHIDPHTVKAHFQELAERLTTDEDHETLANREKRIIAQSMESTANRVVRVRKRLTYLDTQFQNLIAIKKNGKLIPRKKDVDHDLIEKYERMVRNNEILLADLQAQHDAMAMMPPIEAILEAEVEQAIAQKLTSN